MADYDWPTDLVPYAQSFYLQPHVGRSESPFSRAQKVYGLSAPRWITRLQFRGGYDGTELQAGYGRRLDALIAKLKGGLNTARLGDIRRLNAGTVPTYRVNQAALAGATVMNVEGFAAGDIAFLAGDYFSGDGRPHIITDDATADGSGVARISFEPPLAVDLDAGLAEFDNPVGRFRLTSDDAGDNGVEVGNVVGYTLEFVEDIPSSGELPIGWIDPDDYFGAGDYENAYDVKFWSDGTTVWPMIPEADARDDWLSGGITELYEDTSYVSVSLAKKDDPTRQGTAYNTYYVNYSTGSDSDDGLSSANAWKKLSYAIANATRPALIRVEQDWIGTDSFLPASFSDFGNLRILGVPQTAGLERTWVLMTRESVTKASMAWVDNGDGSWTSSAAINDAIKNAPAMFDLSVVDEDGAPLAMVPVVDKATCQATPNSWYNEVVVGATNDVLTVHLTSGAEPNPGVNWAYSEQTGVGGPHTFLMDDGDTGVLENLYFAVNVNSPSTPGIYARALSILVPPDGPRVEHTGKFWLINCGVSGASGNAIEYFDIARGGAEYLVAKDCRDDRFNVHTFYVFSNVNTGDPDQTYEGRHIHLWDFGGIGERLGENGFKSQPALNGSSNVSTCHDQCRTTRLNVKGGDANGSTYADVNGAQTWSINCYGHDPQIAAGGAVPRANYWCDGAGAAGVHAKMRLLYCGGYVDSTGDQFAATLLGEIEYAYFRGKTDVLAGQTGTVTDVTP